MRKDGAEVKRVISIIISIAIIMCALATAMPSFAVNYSTFSCEIVDNEIIITKYIGTGKTSVTVPTTLDGKPVVAIADGAFKGNTELTTVTVKSGVRDIGASAFEDCTALSKITLPDTIIHIGEKAIYNTAYYNNTSNWRLKKTQNGNSSGKVEIGSGTSGGSIDWEDIGAPVLQYLYLGTNLIEIELEGIYSIKYGTRVIADGAFKGNAKAKDVGLPSSLVSIGCNAFEGCTSLESVRNLNVVDYIGDNAFKDCTSLEKINISETAVFNAKAIYNTGYYNNTENWENGVLYMGSRAVATDINNTENLIKDGTTEIIGGALTDNDVVIPASVNNIADNAFVSVENVTIFGFSGTYAETYADDKNIPFVALDTMTKGDVNFNGLLDENDLEILRAVSSLQKYESYAIGIAGDMNEDNAVDGLDVIILDLFLKDIPPSTLKGDANGDGVVDENDYELLCLISSGNEFVKNNFMFNRCDLNEDGAVDGFDAVYLDLILNQLAI